jgi:hypothetical protein
MLIGLFQLEHSRFDPKEEKMNQLEMKEMFRQAKYDPVKYPDAVIEQLARSGYPAAKVITDLNAVLRGGYKDILCSLVSVLRDADYAGDESVLFQEIWRYYSGKEAVFPLGHDPWAFLASLAEAFDSGADNFPVNKRAAKLLYQSAGKLF